MSNVLAGIGRGQLQQLSQRVDARRAVFERYAQELGGLPGVTFMPEATFGRRGTRSTRWLTTMTIDSTAFGATPLDICAALGAAEIEARRVWKPMHQQPVFSGCRSIGGHVADTLFETGVCLPSGSSLTPGEQARVIDVVRSLARAEATVA